MRVCYEKVTKRIIEMQSGGDTEDHLQTLIDNAVRAGWDPSAITCVYMDDAQYAAAQAADPVQSAAKAAQAANTLARQTDMAIILPSWAQVAAAVDRLSNLTDAKVFIKKLTRVVYWLVKNSQT